ncbi:MAG: molybdopterin-binding/glycosyltransferase family 2 protein [Geminicoccaceae bacterium]
MEFGAVAIGEALGAVLAHAVTGPGVAFKKGRNVSAADIDRMREAGIATVVAARLGPDDVGEDEAAARLAQALAGPEVSVDRAFTGRVNLFAKARGVLVVDRERIDAVNGIDESVTVATLPAWAAVSPEEMLATVKIIPFAAPAEVLERCLLAVGNRPLVQVAPFRPFRARLIQTVLPGTSAKMLDKTVRITADRVEALDGTLLGETRCPHETEPLTAAIAEAAPSADMLLVVGASAITDRADVIPAAIEAAGGRVEHFGMPVDPGNLLLLAHRDGRPILGLPGCARSPKLNGFDWVMQRLAAGVPVTRHDIQAMGVGGLLMEIPNRPQPRAGQTSPPSRPRVAAVVLAAGRSSRMGERNKLLVEIDGEPMVHHAVRAARASRVGEIVVVTGHMRQAVEAALADQPVRFVHNPDFAQGLSTSLKVGVAALPEDVDGTVVLLGDMPKVDSGLIDRLIQAFNPVEGRGIVVPVSGGRRGNPVLWGRAYFGAVQGLAGDVGAKHLIGENEAAVVEVDADEGALIDVDTPEALKQLVGAGA